jgi:Apolipoprotein A1/A4/E domain
MANYPKKMTDPTEAALSAIQEALNLGNEEDIRTQPESMAGLLSGATESRQSAVPPSPSEFLDDGPIGTRDLRGPALAGPGAHAANDDQQSIGQILTALQKRPARSSYFFATVFSGAWIAGCLSLSWFYLSDLNATLSPGHSPVALMVGLSAAALLPVIFFFGVAHMTWRAQELRLIAQSMARVAMRLAEPESVARDSIVTVGQAIRREVAAMGDGVERALARASELESLVQSEVAALERTYSDNEVRIRGLLQDLANQRDTLVGQAEQVSMALNNVQIDLSQDLSTISELVGQQVNEAAQRITQSLAERGEQITLTIGQIGDNMIQELSERGGDMLERLEAAGGETARAIVSASEETTQAIAAAGDRTTHAIASASENLTANLDFKTNHIGEEFAQIATGLEDMMNARLDRVTEIFSEKSLAVVDLMIGRSQEMTDAIVDTSNQMAETIAARADEVNSTLRNSGDSLLLDLDLRGNEVVAKLQQAGSGIAESLVAGSAEMTDQMRESAEHVAAAVASHGDSIKEMLAARLASFETMFSTSGVELGEKIGRDSSTLGNLITRHLAEFDRTVKTYGAELVERLGARTHDVSESMRSYVDSFDSRVTAKTDEVTTGLDQRLVRFQEVLDHRSKSLTDSLSARLVDVTKAMTDGGNLVVNSLDKRIGDITTVIDTRAAKLADAVGERITKIDTTLGRGALEVANTLDTRIGHLEELLVGRAENVVQQLETKSRAAAELLSVRMETLSESIKVNSTSAERALTQLAANTSEALGKSAAASTAAAEVLNRSASEATVALNRSAGTLSNTITQSAAAANEALSKSASAASESFGKSAAVASESFGKSAAAASETLGKSASAASESFGKSAVSANEAFGRSIATANETLNKSIASANDVIARSTAAASEAVGRTVTSAADLLSKSAVSTTDAIGRSASEAERKLVGMSAEVSRTIVGKATELNSAMSQRVEDMTRLLDEKSSSLLVALNSTSEQFAGEVGRITDQTVKTIDAKGFVFTQTMLDKSEEIARVINDASLNATVAVTRTLGQMQEGAQGVTEAAKATITRTLEELHQATRTAIEESKQTAASTVAEMQETHTMLRSDSTALFERLREANILLQEVLSGAQENMNSIEHTMAARISEFVAAMSDLSSKSGDTTAKVEQHLGTFNNVTTKVLHDLGDLADQFTSHGRTLADAVELLDISNRRADESVGQRHASIDSLVSTLDARTEDFGQRLERFSTLLEESLDSATTRAREIAGIIADTSNESVQTIEQQYDLVRKTTEEERRRTSETLTAIYDEASGEAQAMFSQSAGRFTEVMQGMKQMATEMQQELETTRAELRRGILELPQETAESAAQMRRVIVDQIEALAELNRIVARHGRSLDAVEPLRREAEPLYATSGGRGQAARPVRADIPPPPAPTPLQQPAGRDITGAPGRRSGPPNLSPVPGGKDDNAGRNNNGWLSDLLTRASRDESPSIAPVAPREEQRPPQRDSVDSIDTLSVDIARMIDHDAAAELWERYKRGERGAFTRRLYTPQGQKAFDEIRNKYRSDPEFRQTVEHYIHEFERLLDDVSRGDRGPTVARNYLTSDTGKVYTMLAHAAGRFD